MSFEKGRAGQSRGVPTACPVSWAGHGAPDHETNRKKRGITPALVEITFHSRAHMKSILISFQYIIFVF